ncbi:DNA polymerase III, delta subunit [Roseovarius nanhaiticus]|uniref:DNA-directed DNA polymerase n=1 Tax=Roseovarius nanhaiticus TaxID=573024 RepID=A0A1N7H2X4_9RHOB|nr:DNA polymerase III subunit delta [Roseovarius nanhaiticus]SEL15474.1 DNA polymerase III, delta subunit [Roseovarius nanhaiticus]SIS19038.1 DNA polymerase III, delta subunit [Roseovarius nanhaiticus]
MKLSPRDAPGYFARPEAARAGLLIYGADAMRIALRRAEVIAALVGPTGEEEMRVTRMPAGELRKDPARLNDAVKAASFFPGPRVAFVEDATEALAAPILAALEDWREGDAQIIVTAGQLKPTSKLRKTFEAHKNAYAAAIYEEPPSRAEIEAMLQKSGLKNIGQEAMRDLNDLGRALDPGDFRQTVEKLALYKLNDDGPVTPEDIAACAPASVEADLDDILHIVAEARSGEIGPMMKQLRAQGVQPVGLVIAASRHFRGLYTAASDPGGVSQGIARMRPPVFGPRRDRMQRQAQAWGAANLQSALGVLTEVDLTLRSAGQTAPQMALVERALIRLAMMVRR